VVSEERRLLGWPSLALWLTDRRLMLRSRENTWRIIPISSIERVTEALPRFFSPHRIVIRYSFGCHSEVLVIEGKSLTGKTLKEALLGLNLLCATCLCAAAGQATSMFVGH
jgi:hypothetical protein